MVWDAVSSNGKTTVRIEELVPTVQEFQRRGVGVYGTRAPSGIAKALRRDVAALDRLGFVTFDGDLAELTGAGELVASTMELPEWAERRLRGG